jgi:hypothetical protein
MKKTNLFSIVLVSSLAIMLMLACNASTANMSSLKTSSDKDGKTESTKFKTGETIYAAAAIANNPGKVKVNLYLTDSKNETMKGSEVSLNLEGDANAKYELPLPEGVPTGTFKLNADMINDAGEKKDTKSVTITIAAE